MEELPSVETMRYSKSLVLTHERRYQVNGYNLLYEGFGSQSGTGAVHRRRALRTKMLFLPYISCSRYYLGF